MENGMKRLGRNVSGAKRAGVYFTATVLRRKCGVDYAENTVIVHQFLKGDFAPSISMFVVKLETYLRMAKIPYEPYYAAFVFGPKGKIPFIEYNDHVMGDSHFIIQFLNTEFDVDLNSHLTPREKTSSWAIQKWLEEFTYWLYEHVVWCLRTDDMGKLLKSFPSDPHGMKKRFGEQTYAQGVGRHSQEEVEELLKQDLERLSEILGDNPYFMGDSPSELDCTAFGLLAEVRWHMPDSWPGKSYMKDCLKNLVDFTDRIKARFWPDWEKVIVGHQK